MYKPTLCSYASSDTSVSFSRGLVRVYQQRKADSSLSFVPSPTLKQDLLKNPKYWDREKKMQWFLEAFCSDFKLEESTMASSITSEQDRSGSFVRFFFCNFQWKLPIHVSNIEKEGGVFKKWYKRNQGRAEIRKGRAHFKFWAIVTTSHSWKLHQKFCQVYGQFWTHLGWIHPP